MNDEMVRGKVQNAIETLIERDAYLLELDAHEVSVSHKLAEYLQQEFPEWNVDCEFNKYYGKTKTLEEYEKDRVRPDIIVHRRGTDEDLLVIEIKLTTSNDDICSEKEKVELYTEDEDLDYQHGLFLHLKAGDEAGVEDTEWY